MSTENYKNWIITGMGIFILFLCYEIGRNEKQSKESDTYITRLENDRTNALKNASNYEVIHDTVYAERDRIKTKYIHITDSIRVQDSSFHADLFRLIYPTIDSANLTYFHLKSAREQLFVMDSVHTIDSLTKRELRLANAKADTMIDGLTKQVSAEQKRVKLWKSIAGLAAIANLIH